MPAASLQFERWLAPFLLFVAAIIVSSLSMERLPATDELYTMLAAQGWAATGAPVIGDGLYERSQLYTVLVGGLFSLFGDSLGVARALSVVMGGLLVVAVFLWTRQVAGALAAWIAALLLCLSPLHVYVSQFARFYALFGLLFWLGAIGLYHVVEQRSAHRAQALLIGAAALGCLAFAVHLQILAGMGLIGLAVWLVATHGAPWLARAEPGLKRLRLLALVVAAAAVVIGVVLASGVAADLWERYRSAPIWNRHYRNEFWFYHVLLNQSFQTLWPVFPFLAIMAIAWRPRPALFCFFVFCTGLLLLSFGGMKDRRYIAFLLPFLFVLWGIALAELIPFLRRHLGPRTRDALRNLAPALARPRVQHAVIAMGLVFLLAANGAPIKSMFRLAGVNLIADGSGAEITSADLRSDWAAARAELSPWLEQADVVLTSHDVQTLYFVGPYDFTLNNNRLSEIRTGEFGLDHRTGKAVVTRPESVELIIDCHQSGVIMAEERTWRTVEAVPPATADVIEARTVPIPLPARFEVLAFRWEHPQDHPRPVACADLREPTRD